jgi:hypothetical protein
MCWVKGVLKGKTLALTWRGDLNEWGMEKSVSF